MSNIDTLPSDVEEYARLQHEKTKLLAEIALKNTRLKILSDLLISKMIKEDRDSFEICPNKAEELKYGEMGSIVLKTKNDYETLTRENLIKYLINFFTYCSPDESQEAHEELGKGMAKWVWNNRQRKPSQYLERSFVEEKKRKKSANQAADSEGVEKKPKQPKQSEQMEKFPQTREEFSEYSSLQAYLQVACSD